MHSKSLAWALVACMGWSAVAQAALPVGAKAPRFTATSALAGQVAKFDLAQALQRGPVVLYFFPKAFTQGCTIEAHAFAEATPQFKQLGASVVGISHDDIETLKRFSSEACRDQFAVASDAEGKTIAAYDAGSAARPGTASRISYVIAPDGTLLFAHEGSDPLAHVAQTLKAVQQWRAEHPQ